MSESNRPFQSTDLYISAFVMARGYPLKGVERNGKKITFLFDGSGETGQLVTEFFEGEGHNVSARAFTNCVRNLKEYVHGGYLNLNGGKSNGLQHR